jgi:hypothetical protein
MKKCMELQAVEALKALLQQLSSVKVRDISVESPGPQHRKEIVARIDVYGQGHVLYCNVKGNGELRNVKTTLRELQQRGIKFDKEITPVLIAPRLSIEARALCRQRQLGFLDLEGNAHLELNEVFFGKRCLPRQISVPH